MNEADERRAMIEMTRTIQTAGSLAVDGPIECDGNSHIWAVQGEWDNPRVGAPCRCGAQVWPER